MAAIVFGGLMELAQEFLTTTNHASFGILWQVELEL